MYLIVYIFILIITNKTTNMNYYAQQLESVAIDVGVDKELPQSEFITAKKVIEKFNELKKENDELKKMVRRLQRRAMQARFECSCVEQRCASCVRTLIDISQSYPTL